MNLLRTFPSIPQRQRGVIFIVMMVILVMGSTAFLVSSLNSIAPQLERDKQTADALAQAKEALIGYAVSVNLVSGSDRPGDLPCPDIDNDGIEETSCGSASGSHPEQRLGRLPWKTLGLPDLRDASGERLWYAVSNNFKYNTRTTCSASGQPGCLNSDTLGTISIFDTDGARINDGGGNTGVVAVIIAPGEALTRQGSASVQDRSGPENGTPKKTASNYLDIATIGGNSEDNALLFENDSNKGFIQGRIRDANGNVIVNDKLLVITQDNIMQGIQKRVVAEVKLCLEDYAANNNGRYPWAAKLDPANPLSYDDDSGRLFGRIPDTPFERTKDDSGYPHMSDGWGGACNIVSNSGWWLNWKEMVFFGIASAYEPTLLWGIPPSCGSCLTVNPPSANADKQLVIMVAGKKLAGQSRSNYSDKGTLSNYLEMGNANGITPFEQHPTSNTFNDVVIFR